MSKKKKKKNTKSHLIYNARLRNYRKFVSTFEFELCTWKKLVSYLLILFILDLKLIIHCGTHGQKIKWKKNNFA